MKSEFRNWSDIRVFLAVVREGSTLAASKTLGMAQPTVARRIEALEHELGLTLFERDTRGFRPTAGAKDLVALAAEIEAAAAAFAGKTRAMRGRNRSASPPMPPISPPGRHRSTARSPSSTPKSGSISCPA